MDNINPIGELMQTTMDNVKNILKVDPIGFLVIKDGNIRMINVTPPASNTVDRLIDMVPQVMDRVDDFITRHKEG